jgi:hypothetical protein
VHPFPFSPARAALRGGAKSARRTGARLRFAPRRRRQMTRNDESEFVICAARLVFYRLLGAPNDEKRR